MLIPEVQDVLALAKTLAWTITTGFSLTYVFLGLIRFVNPNLEDAGPPGTYYISRIPWFDQTTNSPRGYRPVDLRYDLIAAVWSVVLGVALLYTVLPTVGVGLVAASLLGGISVNLGVTLQFTASLIMLASLSEYIRVRSGISMNNWYLVS